MLAALRRIGPLLLLTAACSPSAPTGEYRFFLDGELVRPRFEHIVGEPGAPRSGDLVRLGPYAFVLGRPGEYRMRVRSRLFRELDRKLPDGSRVPWTRSLSTARGPRMETAADWRHLRGVWLREGWATRREVLETLQLERCFIGMGLGAEVRESDRLPETLRYLDQSAVPASQVELPNSMPELRYLALPYCDDRSSAMPGSSPDRDWSWLAACEELRVLDLSNSAVRDTSFLNGHPVLRTLIVRSAPIVGLPTVVLPEFRRLEALDWLCTPDELARFRDLHPRARYVVGPGALLREAFEGAARLEGRGPYVLGQGPLPCPLADHDAISDLLDLLDARHAYRPVWGRLGAGCSYQFDVHDEKGSVLGELCLISDDERSFFRSPVLDSRAYELSPASHEALVAWLAQRSW